MTSLVTPSGHTLLSARDVIQCPTKLQNLLAPDTDNDLRLELPEFTKIIMEEGNEYEESVKVQLATAFANHIVIDTTELVDPDKFAALVEQAREVKLVILVGDRSEASLSLREDFTHALLGNPGNVQLIWNPRLRPWKKDANGEALWSTRSAEPDVLFLQSLPGATPAWGSIDVKHHNPFEGTTKAQTWSTSPLASPLPAAMTTLEHEGKPHKEDALQLVHYYRALEFHDAAGTPVAGIIGKPIDGETRVLWMDLSGDLYERGTANALSLYDELFESRLVIIDRELARHTDSDLEQVAPAVWKGECKECPWKNVCKERLTEADDLSLLAGITEAKLKAHHEARVQTVADLAALDTKTALLVEAKVPALVPVIEAARAVGTTEVGLPEFVSTLDVTTKEVAKIVEGLTGAGVEQISDVARLDLQTAGYKPGTTGLVAGIDQARVTRHARIIGEPLVYRLRGLGELKIPRPDWEIHVDMENDKQVYLWGVHTKWTGLKNGRTKTNVDYHGYVGWEATEECEAKVFAEFWAGLMAMIEKAWARSESVAVFYYTPAENRCMRHIAEAHAGYPGIPTLGEVTAFLDSDIWIDVHEVMTKQLIWPTMDVTLKTLAKLIGFTWRDSDPSGANSVTWYKRAIDPEDPEQQAWQQRILDYNEDDCRATAALLEWLQNQGAAYSLDKKIPRVETLEKKRPRNRAIHR